MSRYIIIAIILLFPASLYAWKEPTHAEFTEYAAEESIIGVCNTTHPNHCGILNALGFTDGKNTALLNDADNGRIYKLLRQGSRDEDFSGGTIIEQADAYIFEKTARVYNHFHTPLKDWDEAGLYDLTIIGANWLGPEYLPVSSVLWAQGKEYTRRLLPAYP